MGQDITQNLFEITKRSPRPTNSILTPAAVTTVRGTACIESPAGQAAPADGTMPIIGFQTRDSQVGGSVLGDIIYPGRLELPFVAGEEGTYEYGDQVVFEGANFVDAGITGATALKTPLSFLNGKIAVATSGQFVEFILVEQQTPVVAGNVRIRAQWTPAYVHA